MALDKTELAVGFAWERQKRQDIAKNVISAGPIFDHCDPPLRLDWLTFMIHMSHIETSVLF